MTRDVGFKIRRGKVGILLLHRLCGTPVEMRFVATGLASKGYTVHCPMLAGHCGSEDALRASTWTDWYHSASLALDDIKKDCDVVIAGGLGARIAELLPRSGFSGRFTAKGRFEKMMSAISVKTIIHPQPGLFGAAVAFAAEHGQ